MTGPSREDRIADYVLDLDGDAGRQSGAEIEQDDLARNTEMQMRETVRALQEWRVRAEAEPVPALRHRRLPSWMWPAGVAAALLIGLGCNLWAMIHGKCSADLARELAWTAAPASVSAPGPAGEVTVRYVRREPETVFRAGGASLIARSEPRPAAPGGSNVAEQSRGVLPSATFAFHMPDRILDGLTLRSAESVGSNRVHLIYAANSRSIAVFLSKSPGPDVALREVKIGERTMVVGRRHGVLAAFDGVPGQHQKWDMLMRDFVNGERAGGRG